MNVELVVSIFGFIASAVSAFFAYLVWKDKKNDDEYKIAIKAKRMTEFWPGSAVSIAIIAVNVINKGRRPVTLIHLYFKSLQQEYIVNTPDLPRILTESDDIALRIRLDSFSDKTVTKITELGVTDSNNNFWKISSRNLKEINKEISVYQDNL